MIQAIPKITFIATSFLKNCFLMISVMYKNVKKSVKVAHIIVITESIFIILNLYNRNRFFDTGPG